MKVLLWGLVLWPGVAFAEVRPVSDVTGLISAINGANPGDVIEVAAGTYRVEQNISVNRPGPVTVVGVEGTTIEFDALEGFKVNAPDWTFEGLTVRGVCGNDSDCEHAFHIVGDADRTVLRRNRLVNFNAQIKANGNGDSPRKFPDDVLIEFNEFFDEAPRQTSNPVTKIDVVGGRRWVVRRNYIHDFAKAEGNGVSYGAFLKGNSRDGLFDANLVVCAQLHSGQTRLGLSFGGGGTGPDSICEDGACTPEHQNGLMRNNVVVGCSDVGIYLNAAAGTRLINNTLVGTSGVDVRFAASTAVIANNFVDGRIRERDGGVIQDLANNVQQVDASVYFLDPTVLNFGARDVSGLVDGGRQEAVEFDYCGVRRDAVLDIGAIEYSVGECDAALPYFAEGVEVGEDAGMPDSGGNGGGDVGMDAGADGGSAGGGDVDVAQDGGANNAVSAGDGTSTPATEDEGCATGGSGVWAWWVFGLVGLARRRRQYIQRPSSARQ